ncbi:MAG: hypothetical protein N2Z74_03670, partial [Syntrophales bacterium]|nr:hypothetical protein [Syntrophales bacterium]
GNGTTDTFVVYLEPKNYRLLINGAKYLPYEYADNTDPKKFIKLTGKTGDQNVDVAPKKIPATVKATFETTDTGFTLKVVQYNFSGAYAMATTYTKGGGNPPNPTKTGGDGSEANPHTYTWTPDGTGPVDNFGNKEYIVNFTFTDGGAAVKNPDGTPYTFTVRYLDGSWQTQNQAKQNSNKTDDQAHGKDQQDFAGDNSTLFVVLGDREFFPLVGTSFDVTLKDVTGAPRTVTINIPPIPLEYLYIDNFDTAGFGNDNLKYTKLIAKGGTDLFAVTRAAAAAFNVKETDILRVKVEYITVGGGAYSNGVSIGFELRDGTPVRYNPILEGRRDPNAPVISIPLLLNPNSPLFKGLSKLSEAKGKLVTLVSEIGDGVGGFKAESLNFTIQDDGLVWMDIHHLSSGGLGAAGGGGGGGAVSTGSSGCFIATAAYGSFLDGHVQILREFRDGYLMTTRWGSAFVELYYRYSPPVADFIAKHEGLKAMVRVALLPAVGFSYVMVSTTFTEKLLILLMMVVLMTATVVVVRIVYRRRSRLTA